MALDFFSLLFQEKKKNFKKPKTKKKDLKTPFNLQ